MNMKTLSRLLAISFILFLLIPAITLAEEALTANDPGQLTLKELTDFANAGGFGPVAMTDIAETHWNGWSKIEKVEISSDKKYIFVIHRAPSMSLYTESYLLGGGATLYPIQNQPSSVWRDIYGMINGEMMFIERQYADVTPEQTIPEKIEWPKEHRTTSQH